MTSKHEPVLRQRIFEARFEKGYLYLDRCGSAMRILEDLLGENTGRLWLPAEASPKSAAINCPDLDIRVVFSSSNFIIDQHPVDLEITLDFYRTAADALSTIAGRFDLTAWRRFGARHVLLMPVDSLEEAEKLSLRHTPVAQWPPDESGEFVPRSFELQSVYETENERKGLSVHTKPWSTVGADVKVDPRLRQPARLQHEHQRDVLFEQLRRQKKRQEAPEAGLLIDVDYYWLWPSSDVTVVEFLGEAWQEADRLASAVYDWKPK